ncbi:hypothetical protein [uncultured Hyphomicrobium sp.]|uniref:hypothetical protein n=1 Tax=uncultured Hyphomicrobium sp. TaxID=194373 RepID=UPI0025E2DA1C|nr:hypothetical protein [uncultured Hyphomicrobium sp.]
MSKKRILTIGLELASDDADNEEFDSKVSLLDWDIVLFKPTIGRLFAYDGNFQGRPSLGDTASFKLKACCEHWRREIKQAVDAGKTIIVYLPDLEEVYVDSGKRSYSGSGRNQKTTVHVGEYNNYQAIPADLKPVGATGKAMKLAARGSEALGPYWSEFEGVSEYKTLLTASPLSACIVTRTGDKPVGAFFRSKSSPGTLVLLPDINFYPDRFLRNDGSEWSAAARKFAAQLLAAVVAMDKALRTSGEITPEPAWAADHLYAIGSETKLRVQLLAAERDVENAQKRKEKLEDQLRSAGAHRALLYEKGKPLEAAIIEALRVLGFTAAAFKDSDSEFDVVFECAEGRLIGEAEGKDNKSVNVDKLRQLAMNIHEDLLLESVSSAAKPVLFGNAFRLQRPSERQEPFTTKCVSAATTSSTALVSTPDLFSPVQYLSVTPDPEYARNCRNAILTTTGLVEFPKPPDAGQIEQVQVKLA